MQEVNIKDKKFNKRKAFFWLLLLSLCLSAILVMSFLNGQSIHTEAEGGKVLINSY